MHSENKVFYNWLERHSTLKIPHLIKICVCLCVHVYTWLYSMQLTDIYVDYPSTWKIKSRCNVGNSTLTNDLDICIIKRKSN